VAGGRLINLGRQNYATRRAAAANSCRLVQLRMFESNRSA
jgi:hypothetical protein